MAHKIDVKFYPGWTRKAITFSIDDGILDMDKKFMDIVEPYGSQRSSKFGRCTPLHQQCYGRS